MLKYNSYPINMTRLTYIVLIVFLVACHSTKHTTSYNKITSGQDLDKVVLISFDSFFKQWVFNRKISKFDLNVKQLYSDSQFTYFGKPKPGFSNLKWSFFKVYSDTLAQRFPNYLDFYGTELSSYLWSEVIPKEDKDLWNYNRTTQQNATKPNCSFKKNKPINNYTLIDNKVILTMTWDIECKELQSLKNKIYKASYNLLTKQFQNESIDNK